MGWLRAVLLGCRLLVLLAQDRDCSLNRARMGLTVLLPRSESRLMIADQYRVPTHMLKRDHGENLVKWRCGGCRELWVLIDQVSPPSR